MDAEFNLDTDMKDKGSVRQLADVVQGIVQSRHPNAFNCEITGSSIKIKATLDMGHVADCATDIEVLLSNSPAIGKDVRFSYKM